MNFTALPMTFSSTWRSRPASPSSASGTSGVMWQASSIPFSAARSASSLAASPTVSRRSNSARSRSSRRASIFEKSRMSLTISSSDSADDLTVARYSRCSAESLVRSASASCRGSALSGVRISWLMLARKALFASVASSARRFAISSSLTSCARRAACSSSSRWLASSSRA